MSPEGVKVVAANRRARHDFELIDTYEAGLVLTGTEVKSLRSGKVSLAEAYGRTDGKEIFVLGLDIPQYKAGNRFNHEPRRKRKLLLKKQQINKIMPQLLQRGLTLVLVRIYFRRGWAKIEIAVGRGKKRHDKREDMKKRDHQRDIERAMKPSR